MRWLLAGLKVGLIDLDVIELRVGSTPALDGELATARKRMAKHGNPLSDG